MSNTEVPKWVCDYCTFENWPSAVKCTLCRGAKPPRLIGDELNPVVQSNTQSLSYGILHSDHQGGENHLNTINIVDGVVNATKWSCSRCTYQNWPKANKCTQCLTPKSNANMPHAIHNTSNAPDSGNVAESRRLSPLTSPELLPMTLPLSSAIKLSDLNRPHFAAKWVCLACTYENWPKSIKCVLCTSPRRAISPPSWMMSLNSPLPHPIQQNQLISCASDGDAHHQQQAIIGGAGPCTSSAVIATGSNNYEREMRLRQLRRNALDTDRLWLDACLGIVDGDSNLVEAYLTSGGDPSRQLTESEVNLLDRPSAFDAGHTLVHLAIRFHRDDMLALLLAASETTSSAARKRVPSHVSPDLATDLRRHICASLRQRKGDFPCSFVSELATFSLPAEIEDLPPELQEHLLDELLDRGVQKELEEESPIINWSLELTERLGSRLYALWNRTAGDCLLDSVLQATWGVFDRDNSIRRALSDSLHNAASTFYPRWKEYEACQANLLHFSLDESQCIQDWEFLLSLASQPGASLEQLHIFALAHLLRRPIIVYGVKYVKSFRGEPIGFARFEGVYLPLLWEQTFCWKSPISLGYTRGHFSALVSMEPDSDNGVGAGANIRAHDDLKVVFLPLTTSDGKLLPVHFLSDAEVGHEEQILRQWLDCCIMDGGVLVAQQRIQRRPLLVAQMVDEWLNHYRRMCPSFRRMPSNAKGNRSASRSNPASYSSDGSDD